MYDDDDMTTTSCDDLIAMGFTSEVVDNALVFQIFYFSSFDGFIPIYVITQSGVPMAM